MSNKFEFGRWPLDEDDRIAEIEQGLQRLAREGLIVDSGRRRWSDRTKSYQIVWVAREFADRKQKNKRLC